jgi:hypothetical protein
MAWKTSVATIVALWFAQVAWAGNLVAVGGPITWISGTESSCHFVIGVDNTGANHPLIGWQLKCEIIPIGNTTGSVSFGTIGAPSNYVFGSLYRAVKVEGSASSTLIATDDITSFGDGFLMNPVTVSKTGMELLDVELISSWAAGRFNVVVAVGTEADSVWYSDTFAATPFDVNTLGWESPIIESVVFSAPEPSHLVLLLSGTIGLAIARLLYLFYCDSAMIEDMLP